MPLIACFTGRNPLLITPAAAGLRRGQVYRRVSSEIKGAPKRSDGDLLVRVLTTTRFPKPTDEQEFVPTEERLRGRQVAP
jgi:hypothetical protein